MPAPASGTSSAGSRGRVMPLLGALGIATVAMVGGESARSKNLFPDLLVFQILSEIRGYNYHSGFGSQPAPGRSAQLENFLPDFFVPGPLLDFRGADRIKPDRPNLIHRLDFRMRRQAPAGGVSFLALLARRPAIEQLRGLRMRRVFGERVGGDRRDAFGQHVAERRALLDAQRIVVRVAGQAGGRLAGDEKLRELRVAFVKLDVIGRDFAQKVEGLLVVF